jgi:hypothetical protein
VPVIWLFAERFLPDRGDQSDDNLQALSRDGYLTEVVIPPRSLLCEVILHESRLQRRFDVDVLDVHRDGQRLQPPLAQLRLQAADRLLLRCSRQELLRLQQDRMVDLAGTLLAEELPQIRHAEVLVPAGSLLAGATLASCVFAFQKPLRFSRSIPTGPVNKPQKRCSPIWPGAAANLDRSSPAMVTGVSLACAISIR